MIENILAERLFGIPYALLAAVALIIAVVFVFVVTTGTAIGWRWFVLRWFHSLCWVLLASAALLKTKALPLPDAAAGPVAVAGGIAYAVFLVTLVMGR
jgi:hypothetical protein